VRIAAWLLLLAVCPGALGCRLIHPEANRGGLGDRPAPLAGPPPHSPDTTGALPPPPPHSGGLLAGRVLDNYSQHPPPAYIRVVPLGATATSGSAPIEVATDADGYFTIQGLTRDQHYQLIARAREGERLLAGTTYATPPDAKLIIRISEDYVTPATPPLPGEPVIPRGKTNPPRAPGNDTPPGTSRPPVELGTPRPSKDPPAAPPSPGVAAPATTPVVPVRPQDVVNDTKQQAKVEPKPADIHGPGPRVPFCVVKNSTLDNLTLNDLDGQPWDFRQSKHGRLVLLDFWGTWCVHCKRAIPELVALQSRYQSWGLDVIGVTYETEGTPAEQVQRIKGWRDRLGINYRLLLGTAMETCPVREQFNVRSFPTLILLDDTGRILWRSEGLDTTRRQQLEAEIRLRLGVR
jgi:thiol-disulfide isomerase/thioredoxin